MGTYARAILGKGFIALFRSLLAEELVGMKADLQLVKF